MEILLIFAGSFVVVYLIAKAIQVAIINPVENIKSRRRQERTDQEYSVHPENRYLDQIRGRKNLIDRGMFDFLTFSERMQASRQKDPIKYPGRDDPDFVEVGPVTRFADRIRRDVEQDAAIDDKRKVSIYRYMDEAIGAALGKEAKERNDIRVARVARQSSAKREKEERERLFARRRALIDRVACERSYVLLEATSPHVRGVPGAFVFKSNMWEYTNGNYVVAGGQSYDHAVVSLFRQLRVLKKAGKIKKIDPYSDPQAS